VTWLLERAEKEVGYYRLLMVTNGDCGLLAVVVGLPWAAVEWPWLRVEREKGAKIQAPKSNTQRRSKRQVPSGIAHLYLIGSRKAISPHFSYFSVQISDGHLGAVLRPTLVPIIYGTSG
jgi:hypothetical protein